MKLYGLYSEERECLMAFSTSVNEGDFCNNVEYELSIYGGGSVTPYGQQQIKKLPRPYQKVDQLLGIMLIIIHLTIMKTILEN